MAVKLFTQEQIQELLSIVDYHSSFLVAQVLGKDSLSSYDKYVLRNAGIDIDKIARENPSYYQMYLWGKLSADLSNQQGGRVDYDNFKKYIERGQYIPLSPEERARYNIAKQNTYNSLKFNTEKQKAQITSIISDEMKSGVEKRKSLKSIVSEIGHKAKDWQRDWGRIVDTEYNNIFQEGRAETIRNKKGDRALVFKDVYSGACKHCIKFYLTNGIGSKPRIFTLEELEANGSNVGKKQSDWKPTISSTHPHCRCSLRSVPEGYEWDSEQGKFTPSKKYETKREVKATLKVGDKEFQV